jgi:hypothetical protein
VLVQLVTMACRRRHAEPLSCNRRPGRSVTARLRPCGPPYCARLATDVLASERRRDVDRYSTVRALASSLIDVYFEVGAFSSSGEP